MKNKITILYVPCPDPRIAKKISLKLLNDKLAACVQSFQAKSMYPWNRKIERANETILIVKTLNKKAAKAKSTIQEHHTYEVPCILNYKVGVNNEYYNWMKEILH